MNGITNIAFDLGGVVIALSYEQAKAEETIFVDDGPRNVEVAADMGMQTLCPKNNEDWTDALEAVL